MAKIPCVWCDQTFTDKISLANHFDNVHKTPPVDSHKDRGKGFTHFDGDDCTPPVDSKGAAIEEKIQDILDDYTALHKEPGDARMFWSFAVEPATKAILAILAQEVKRVIGEIVPIRQDATEFEANKLKAGLV